MVGVIRHYLLLICRFMELIDMINIVLGLSNLVIGLIMILLSIPLKNGSIKMNYWYGFRFPKSFESDDAWYKINEFGAERFIKWSIPILVAGLFSFFIPFDNMFLILFFSFFPIIILIPVYECYLFTKNL